MARIKLNDYSIQEEGVDIIWNKVFDFLECL